jgi:hypothetical protein
MVKFYKNKKDIYEREFKPLNTDDRDIYEDNPLEILIFDKVKKMFKH